MTIGKFIKYIREKRGFIRTDLEECCSEKTLYLIESDKTTPTTKVLVLLSEKLHVNFLLYLNKFSFSKSLISNEEAKELANLNAARDYEELYKRSSSMNVDDYEESISDIQLIRYYQARASYYLHTDYRVVLESIEEILSLSLKSQDFGEFTYEFLSIIEIKTILLKAFVLLDNKMYEECYEYLKDFVLDDVDPRFFPVEVLVDIMKMNYNKMLARISYSIDDDITKELDTAIKLCKRCSMYDQLAKYYFLYTRYYNSKGDMEECYRFCYLYIGLCEVQENDKVKDMMINMFKDEYDYDHKKMVISKL